MKLTFARFELPEIKDFDGGIFALQKLEDQFQGVLQSIKEKQRDLVRARFQQGYIVSTLIETANKGDAIVEKLSQATGISMAILYDAAKFYKYPDFGSNPIQLEAWFEKQDLENKPANWNRVRNMLGKRKDSTIVEIDRERQDIENRAIQLEDDAERLTAKITSINESNHVIDQAKGVAGAALEVAKERRDQMALMEVKPERIEDRNYLKFVKQQPCIITGALECDPHHFLTGGMGTKGSDYATVPLTRELHNELHNKGKEAFQTKYGVDFWREMARLMHLYFVGVPPELMRDAA